MKRVGISIIFLVIILGLGGCKKDKHRNDLNESMTWERVDAFEEYTDPLVSENLPKEEDFPLPNCWVHVEILYPSVKDASYMALRDSLVKALTMRISLAPLTVYSKDSVQAFVNKYVEDQVRDYKEDIKQASALDFDVFSYSVFSRRIDICDSLAYNKNGIVSITMLSQEYSGGAHGNEVLTTFNYDLDSKIIITSSVLFNDPKDKRLRDLLLAKLIETLGVNSAEELEYAGVFSYQVLEVTNNFYFTPEGIVFYYNPYELAAYAVGPIELYVDYAELAPYLNGEYNRLLPK